MSKYRFFLIIVYCLFLAASADAQEGNIPIESWKEAGLPYIQNFTPKDYDFHPQNWAIVQDHRGIMFIANTAGMLEYDGVHWKQHQFFKNLTIASAAINSEGTIYIGGRGDFGYLKPDSSGQLRFVSLTSKLDEKYQGFKVVWEIAAATHGIYFRTSRYIFRWNGEKIKTWDTPCHYMTVIRDTVYTATKKVGLQWLNGDTLQLLPGGERFANTTMYVILPYYDHAGLLLGTRTDGLYIYDGSSIYPFQTEAENYFKANRLYHGVKLNSPEPLWALATTRGGLIVIDPKGRVRQLLNKSVGLLDDKVHFVYRDRQGALWLSLNNGISRVEFPSPFSIFDERLGLEGTPHAIARHQGKIYIATNRGIFYLNESPDSFVPVFELIPDISSQVWCLLSTHDALLVGAADGIYEVQGNDVFLVTKMDVATYCLHKSRQQENIVYAGTRNGLVVLHYDSGWKVMGKIDGITEEIQTIDEEPGGILWLGTAYQGIWQLKTKNDAPLNPDYQRFSKDDGLPEGMTYVYLIDNQVRIGTYRGLYRFNQKFQFFFPDTSLGAFLADSLLEINYLVQSKSGYIWSMAGKKGEVRLGQPTNDNGYVWQSTPFQRMVDMNSVMDIMPEKENLVWFVGRDEKIYHYDPTFSRNYKDDFSTLIRRVSFILSDSLIWDGAFLSGQKLSLIKPIPHNQNSIRFEYAAASFDESSANRYQVKLEGYDKEWLPWTAETKKDYTGLPTGAYTFRIRARNIYDHLGEEGAFSFTILSPWHQTWWAYLIYGILALGVVALVVKGRVRRLEKKTKELESKVAERTVTIREQAEKLKELDRMKSRFFANISHEFRTPLTLILGPLQDVIAKVKDKTSKEDLAIVHRNANRLLQLINQLLDISRLESGRMKLSASRGDFIAFLKGIVMSFASLAEQKKIKLNFHVEPSEGLEPSEDFYFDHDKIEKIFYNLLSNAFKFTPEGGKVTVDCGFEISDLGKEHEKESKIQSQKSEMNQFTIISVRDTGVGISSNRLPHIFDRFYQVDSSSTREHEGTGIGLALTKELVELHHGQIEVDSEEGKGTKFVVHLPLGKEHLQEDEIMEEPTMPQPSESFAPSLSPQLIRETEPSGVMVDSGPEPAQGLDHNATIILAVDDHPDVRNYIRKHLEREYHIIEAKDGKEGVEIAVETIPDLVISDVMMPELDGYQLCEDLKTDERTSHIPVILLTAKAGEEDKLAGLETGADDYLTKPFSSKELRARVGNLIEQRKKLRQRFIREGMLQPREVAVTSFDDEFLQKLMNVIEEHLSEEEFSVEALSQKMNMGRRQLHRKIRALTNQTPTDFIRSVRLQRARQLLEQHAGTISEIAFDTGFSSLSYFSKAFREQFGKLPSEFTDKE